MDSSMRACLYHPRPVGGHRADILEAQHQADRVACMDLGLRGRVAFVAASSKGMGRATAEQFAAEGADVGICARSAPELQTAAESIRAHGVRVVATEADLSSAEQTKLAVERTVAELGRLDALIVNAGGPSRASFDELDDDRWEAPHPVP